MIVHNNTNLSLAEIVALPLIGRTISKWRGRTIDLRQAADPDQIVSIGTTFDKSMQVISLDPKDNWHTALDYIAQGQVYVSE